MGRWTALDCVAIQKGEAAGKGMATDFECDFALFWRSHKAHVNGQVKHSFVIYRRKSINMHLFLAISFLLHGLHYSQERLCVYKSKW